MGVSDPEHGLMWATGIVGAGAPIANGFALASQIRDDGRVTLASFGDGATSIGFVHEAMNMAAAWDLPVVFLCQNNRWAEHTPVEAYAKNTRLSDRAVALGMAGETVDGKDPVVVHDAIAAAAARARSGEGPAFVEAVAYRLQGHYFGDGMAYVDPEELAAARAADPFDAFRRRLVDDGVARGDVLDALDAEVQAEVDGAMEFALASPGPSTDELYVDVYESRSDDGSRAVPNREVNALPDGPVEELGLVGAINRTLDRAMARDESIVLLGEDIADPAGGLFKVTDGLSTKYGTARVRATPIAESAIVGAAIGASMAGLRPVAELMFMDFVGVCLDQIANHAAKIRYMSGGRQHAPMVIRTAVGVSSGPQHSQAVEPWLMNVPGLKVVWPSTSADAVGLLNTCLEDPDPCVFIESMALYFGGGRSAVPVADFTIPLGRADVKRPGSDATIVTYGPTVMGAMAVAEELAAEGTQIEVVDLRSLVPLDLDTVLESVAKTKRLVVAHESPQFCGPGAEIAAAVGRELFGELAAPIARVGGAHTPIARAAELEFAARPNPARIAEALRAVCA
jgi:2-oxoisovalerate dehydrogenase E1 component